MATRLYNYHPVNKTIRAVVNTKNVITRVDTKVISFQSPVLTAAEITELNTEIDYFNKARTQVVKYKDPTDNSRPVLV